MGQKKAEERLEPVSEATVSDVPDADIAILGCLSTGAVVLKESEFEPFNDSIIDKIAGKRIALCVSYD